MWTPDPSIIITAEQKAAEAAEAARLTKLYKSTFIRRMSPSEAATMEQVLQDEEPWLRMLYHSVEYFMMDDALIMYLHMTLEGAFGEVRADELLEPEV